MEYIWRYDSDGGGGGGVYNSQITIQLTIYIVYVRMYILHLVYFCTSLVYFSTYMSMLCENIRLAKKDIKTRRCHSAPIRTSNCDVTQTEKTN